MTLSLLLVFLILACLSLQFAVAQRPRPPSAAPTLSPRPTDRRRQARVPTKIPVVNPQSDDDTVNGSGIPKWAKTPITPRLPGFPPGQGWVGTIDIPCQIGCPGRPKACTPAQVCGRTCYCRNFPSQMPTPAPAVPSLAPTITISTTSPPTVTAEWVPPAPSSPPVASQRPTNTPAPSVQVLSGLPTFFAFSPNVPTPAAPTRAPLMPFSQPMLSTVPPTPWPTRTPRPTTRPSLRPSPEPTVLPTFSPSSLPTPRPSTLQPTPSIISSPMTSAPSTSAKAVSSGSASGPALSSGTLGGIIAGVVLLFCVVVGYMFMRARDAKEDSRYKFWLKRKIDTGTLFDVPASGGDGGGGGGALDGGGVTEEERQSTVADYTDIYITPQQAGMRSGGPRQHQHQRASRAIPGGFKPYVAEMQQPHLVNSAPAPGSRASMLPHALPPTQMGHQGRYSHRPPPPSLGGGPAGPLPSRRGSTDREARPPGPPGPGYARRGSTERGARGADQALAARFPPPPPLPSHQDGLGL